MAPDQRLRALSEVDIDAGQRIDVTPLAHHRTYKQTRLVRMRASERELSAEARTDLIARDRTGCGQCHVVVGIPSQPGARDEFRLVIVAKPLMCVRSRCIDSVCFS